MTLESTIVCIDNSEYSRNGDFSPSRLGAQQDCVATISRAKIRQNPENNVGLLAFGGVKPTLVTTLSQETNRILSKFAELGPEGESNNFTIGMRIAHLALKHRQSKNHRQRIVSFVCSPMSESESDLIKLAKKLKKENVKVDVVNFGEDDKNVAVLSKFIETLNGKNQEANVAECRLLNVPSGQNLNDGVRQSAILGGNEGASAGTAGAGADFGGDNWMDDPNMDPDLALALRVSLEESRARQQQEANQTPAAIPETIGEEAEEAAAAGAIEANAGTEEAETMDDDVNADEMLMQALQMSLQQDAANATNATAVAENIVPLEPDDDNLVGEDSDITEVVDFAAMTEEQQIEYALRMSMQEGAKDDEGMEE